MEGFAFLIFAVKVLSFGHLGHLCLMLAACQMYTKKFLVLLLYGFRFWVNHEKRINTEVFIFCTLLLKLLSFFRSLFFVSCIGQCMLEFKLND